MTKPPPTDQLRVYIEQNPSQRDCPLNARNLDETKSRRTAGVEWFAERRAKLRRLLRQLRCASILLLVFAASYYFSFWLRFEGQMDADQMRRFSSTIGYVILIKLLLFGWFRMYQGWGRFVTFYDLVTLVQAATGSLLAMVLVDRFFLATCFIPRTVHVLDWGTTIVLVGGIRGVLRAVQERNWMPFVSVRKVPAFIVGANHAGEALLRTIVRNEKLGYQVVGFLDDDERRRGTRIGGVPVIGSVDQTCVLAESRGVRDVLIASGGLSGKQVRQLVDEARLRNVRVKVLPSYDQLIRGSVSIRPRPVAIDDLLRRDPVRLEMDHIRHWIDGRTLLVTGSAGSIGSEICRQLLQFSPKKIVLVDRNENGQFFLQRELDDLARGMSLEICIADVLDESRMREILAQHQPEIIFHAAAYKHVPLMEAHPGEAVKNIVTATKQLADLAGAAGVGSFVLISTDKAVNPTSVMGACKRVAEIYLQSLGDVSTCRFVTVRFGNVLDSAGSVVQVFRQQIASGGPVTVTDERMQRYFMTIPEAARLVIQAGVVGGEGEILLLDMGEPVYIVDLAADMIRLSGLEVGVDVDIEIVGLRPGEKLFEELHADGEKHLPTRHSKIVVADRQRRDSQTVLAAIERLQALCGESDDQVVEELCRIVPEYRRLKTPTESDKRAA